MKENKNEKIRLLVSGFTAEIAVNRRLLEEINTKLDQVAELLRKK